MSRRGRFLFLKRSNLRLNFRHTKISIEIRHLRYANLLERLFVHKTCGEPSGGRASAMDVTTMPLCCSLYVISMGIANEESSHSGSTLLFLSPVEKPPLLCALIGTNRNLQMTNIPTNQLFLLLKTVYPEKNWQLIPYTNFTGTSNAIVMSHDGTSIHNPMESDCGRFEQADRFGLKEEHARMLRRHNREYALQLTGSEVDLRVIFEQVVAAAKSNGSGSAEPFLDDFGFQPRETSPGQVAYLLEDRANQQLRVTDRSGSTLPDLMRNVWIQLVGIDGLVLASYLR